MLHWTKPFGVPSKQCVTFAFDFLFFARGQTGEKIASRQRKRVFEFTFWQLQEFSRFAVSVKDLSSVCLPKICSNLCRNWQTTHNNCVDKINVKFIYNDMVFYFFWKLSNYRKWINLSLFYDCSLPGCAVLILRRNPGILWSSVFIWVCIYLANAF